MFTLKNNVQIIGHLGNDPLLKTTESGKKLARFSVATNESYWNASGEKVVETQWHQIVAWERLAEVVEKYLVKGAEIAASGKIVNRNYTDDDGNKRYVSEIQLNEILFLSNKAN